MVDGDGNAKLADFGSAKIFEGNDMMKGSVGTYHFFAPELCDENVKEYSGCAADIWALGVTLYAMVYNRLPFLAPTEMDLLDAILKEDLKMGARNLSEGLSSLLTGMLDKNLATRLNLKQIKMHSWVNDGYRVNLSEPGAAILKQAKNEDK